MAAKLIKVLYLSYDGLTDPLGQSQVLPYLAGLAARGYAISIISFEKPGRYAQLHNEIRKLTEANGLKWFPLSYTKDPPLISTLYDIARLRLKATELHRSADFSIVHCRSYITSLVGWQLKKKFGIKFIFDMRGFWADERIEGGIWNLNNPIYKMCYSYFKKKELLFLNNSDAVVSLTSRAKNIIEQWKTKATIVVIPCCVDTVLFDPNRVPQNLRDNLKTQLGIKKEDAVLLYLGSWGTWYMTSEMLDFFSRIKKLNPNAKFLIVSPDKVDLKDHEHASSIIVRSVQRADVPLYISLASAAVLFIRPTFSKTASSATKMGELLAMNVPIVTNPGWGDVDEMVKETKSHFGEALQHLPAYPLNEPTRAYCIQHMGLEFGVEQYARLYDKVATLRI